MNLHLRKRRNLTKKLMSSSLLLPNGQLIILSTLESDIFVFSTLLLKQLRKFRLISSIYSFSPSSQQLAIGPFKGGLYVVMIGSHKQVYNQLLGSNAKIGYIKFKNETILIAASFQTSEIFTVDISTQNIIQIIKMSINHSSLDYGDINDVLIFVERRTKYLQVWSAQDGSKLFQSETFSEDLLVVQLIDSKNLALVKFFDCQILYQIDYQNKEIHPYQYQIPKSIYGYIGSQIHDDQILTIASYNKKNPYIIIVLFDQIDQPQTITKGIQMHLNEKRIQSFKAKNKIFITIIAQDKQKYHNTHFYLIRISKK